MKYRILIDCPGLKKGQIVREKTPGHILIKVRDMTDGVEREIPVTPAKYPDIFQLIPEKTRREKIDKWAKYLFSRYINHDALTIICGSLERGGFDPDKLEGK